MIRQYINITNNCDANCEFCCMWSDSSKNTFMNFDTFKKIIDEKQDDFELQLEGGEPTLHPDLFLFMEYARSTNRCKKIIILTNGLKLDNYLKRLIDFANTYNIPILIKMSINYWLLKLDPNLIEKAKEYHSILEFTKNIDIFLNVRLRYEDEWLKERIENQKMNKYANIFYLQSYGKYEEKNEYSKPIIVQNIDDWFIYSCDGECFDKDLIKRSEHEKVLK